MKKQIQTEIIEMSLGHCSRMIGGSKSGYISKYPDRKPIFNANIITKSQGKIWYGDLDLVSDRHILEQLPEKLEENVYILRELDCRFGTENDPIETLILKAVETFKLEK